jgi:hypothetical protein
MLLSAMIVRAVTAPMLSTSTCLTCVGSNSGHIHDFDSEVHA